MSEGKEYTLAQKMEIAAKAVHSGKTADELGEEYGVTGTTVANWRKKLLPGDTTLKEMQEKSIAEIERDYDRKAGMTKVMAIQRIMTLVPQEDDIDKLSKLIKELKVAKEDPDPGKKAASPWATQINNAIKEVHIHKTTIENGNSKGDDRFKRGTT